MALDGAERADLARLRHERTNRVFEAMDRDEVDVLVLGREGNARYASGLQRLPVAVARPFIPSAVLVREARATHALSGWDFVTAPEISPEQQYPTHWDPAAVAKAIGRIDGVPGARRVALDSVSPQWRERLSSLCKAAGFVDAGPLMRAVRMVKTEDEVFCIRTAVAIAEAGLVAASAILGPGRRERELLGAFVERMSEFGLTVPASEAFALWRLNGSRIMACDVSRVIERCVRATWSPSMAGFCFRVTRAALVAQWDVVRSIGYLIKRSRP